VPIGFGLAGTGLAYRPHSVLRTVSIAVGTLSVSIAVSVTAEFLQVFAPGRVVAAADVVAQTLGCALGLALWAACGQALTSWLRESRAPTHDDRLTRALVGYAVLWAFANLAPFDFTLDPESLAAW